MAASSHALEDFPTHVRTSVALKRAVKRREEHARSCGYKLDQIAKDIRLAKQKTSRRRLDRRDGNASHCRCFYGPAARTCLSTRKYGISSFRKKVL